MKTQSHNVMMQWLQKLVEIVPSFG